MAAWKSGTPRCSVSVCASPKKERELGPDVPPRPRGTRKQRLTLGAYPKLSLAKAREQARDALVQVSKGNDPVLQAKELQQADTFETVAGHFIERTRSRKKSSKAIPNAISRLAGQANRLLGSFASCSIGASNAASWRHRPWRR
jgi:hypothetical protein